MPVKINNKEVPLKDTFGAHLDFRHHFKYLCECYFLDNYHPRLMEEVLTLFGFAKIKTAQGTKYRFVQYIDPIDDED